MFAGRVLAGACCAAALVMGQAAVHADTATANLGVSATVVSSCSVAGATLAFGNYNPTSAANVDQSTTFQVTCTRGTSATVGMDLGTNASGSTRRMSNGTDFLAYELYKEAARTNVWGNAGAALVSLAAAPSSGAQTLNVYGRVAGSQDVGVGNYSDTVVITVTF